MKCGEIAPSDFAKRRGDHVIDRRGGDGLR